MIMPSPFLGAAYESRTLILNAQRAINVYPELVESHDGKEVGGFYGTPGLDLLAEVGFGPIRGLHVLKDALYVVTGNAVFRVSTIYTQTLLGILQTAEGTVGMADNGTQLLIVDGVDGYGYDTSTGVFNTIGLPFSGPVACAFQDGFFVANQKRTEQWWQSGLNDVWTWDGLNFSSADGQPDPVVTMLDNHREVWLFGQTTSEVWINGGNPGFAFQRLQGVFLQEGCVAPYSAAIVGPSPVWLGRTNYGQGIVFEARGYQPVRISTHAIEREIQSYSRIDDAIGFSYQQEGHIFYVLTFPTADKTWVYDQGTGLWHERAWFDNAYFHRIRSNCYAFFNGLHVTGDWENGKLYAYNLDTYTDAGQIRKWVRSWPALKTGQINFNSIKYNEMTVYFQPGIGNSLPPGDNPQCMLRFSNDGGLSWSNEHWTGIGKIGETQYRSIWRRTGTAKRGDRIWEISGNEPNKFAAIAAVMDATPGVS